MPPSAPHTHRPRSSALRRGRVSLAGHAYLLTTVTHGRAPVFSEFALARAAVAALRACDEAGECQTLAFVLMPDHLHWLLILQGRALDAVMRRFKSVSARQVNGLRGVQGVPLWQPGFHDHALRGDEDWRAAARYVVGNPVRAGLVASVMDYPHWDAIWV
ncbi:MAG: transposase [Pseudomonadota bacterium]|nr:transposase [Pseudomonadota bacterium]